MKTFVILYRKGIHGPILGWFGEFQSEEMARDIFPFPQCSIQIVKVIEVPSEALGDFLEGSYPEAINSDTPGDDLEYDLIPPLYIGGDWIC